MLTLKTRKQDIEFRRLNQQKLKEERVFIIQQHEHHAAEKDRARQEQINQQQEVKTTV